MALLVSPVATAAGDGPEAATSAESPFSCEDSVQCRARNGYGSVCNAGRCEPYRDETDLFIAVGLSEKQQARPKAFEPLLAVLPAFAYNPTVGFLFGAVGIFGMYLGDPDTTTISSLQAMVLYTTKNQFITQVNSTIITEGNTWELQGDWRFMIFNQDTFGLGTGHNPVSQGLHDQRDWKHGTRRRYAAHGHEPAPVPPERAPAG